MPPKRKTRANPENTPEISAEMEQIIAQRVADAIAAHEANKGEAAGGSEGAAGQGSTSQGCSYKEFTNCKPLNFKGSEGAIGMLHWFEKMESVFIISECTENRKVKYATCTLQDRALTWWNAFTKTVGLEVAYQISWDELKGKMTEEYCPRNEIQKLETELRNLKVKGDDIVGYTNRFHELVVLCPVIMKEEYMRIEQYTAGLPGYIQSDLISAEPTTIEKTIRLAHKLMDQRIRFMVERNSTPRPFDKKRKWVGNEGRSQGPQQGRPEAVRAYAAGPGNTQGYAGAKPYCNKCNRHHPGPCANPCGRCKKPGHHANDCRTPYLNPNPNPNPNQNPNPNPNPKPANNNTRAPGNCYNCGNPGHFKNNCPQLKNQGNNRGRAFNINAGEARQDPNIVTGTFLLNDHYATVLFDSGADYSFVSTEFMHLSPLINRAGKWKI